VVPVSRFPTAKLRTRLVAMAAEHGVAVVAADPAYTSKWGARHWLTPLRATHSQTTRQDAAGIVIGRRGQGHPTTAGATPHSSPPTGTPIRRPSSTVPSGPAWAPQSGPCAPPPVEVREVPLRLITVSPSGRIAGRA
jgi:hypothetical protein